MKPLYVKAFVIFSAIFILTHCQASTPEEITINQNGIHLKGKFYIPESTGIFPTVILLQGFPGNEQDVFSIGEKLSETGFNALTFNYSGTYHSEGEYSFENTQKDIEAVFEFIYRP